MKEEGRGSLTGAPRPLARLGTITSADRCAGRDRKKRPDKRQTQQQLGRKKERKKTKERRKETNKETGAARTCTAIATL